MLNAVILLFIFVSFRRKLATGTYTKNAARPVPENPKKKRVRKGPYSRSESKQSLTSVGLTEPSTYTDNPPKYDAASTVSGSYYPSRSDHYTPTLGTNQSYDPEGGAYHNPPPLSTYSTPAGGRYVEQQPIRGGLYRASMNSPPHSIHTQAVIESEL